MMQLVKFGGVAGELAMADGQSGETPSADMQCSEKKTFSVNSVHALRTAQLAALTLSQMADQKANILIGATFVVFSLLIGQAFGDSASVAMLCLAGTAFLASFFAVLAIMPRISTGAVPKEQINPLFFSHFAEMDEHEWADEILQRAASDEQLYRMMLRDLYQNGQVLHRRKYRFLSIAYWIFLAGLALTLAVFIAESTL
jgi:hypothetical protein